MDVTETAWAAGLFDGEGSISLVGGWFKLQLKMCDRETIERFAVAVGTSTEQVLGPYANRMGEKDGYTRSDFHVWVSRVGQGARVLDRLWPWLSETRKARATTLGYTPMSRIPHGIREP